jgi:glycosyltransferase involved in cell wall biosynthesis
MRVVHFIPQFPYFGGHTVVGGHASSLARLAAAQVSRGIQVTILTHIPGAPGTLTELRSGIPVVSLERVGRLGTITSGLRLLLAARAWARRHSGEFDVVHGHSGYADYMAVSTALGRALAAPVVHTLYCPIPNGINRWNAPVARQVLLKISRGVDRLIGISMNVQRSLRDFGIPTTQAIQVVPPPVDIERFRPRTQDEGVRKRLGIPEQAVVLLFVGSASRQKNLARVIRAFGEVRRRHDEARLVVTTELPRSSPARRLSHLRALTESLGLSDSVIQLGIVEDMPALMRSCDLLVVPFLTTRGPSDYFVAALEAMATGLPVVTSAVGGMPEVIDRMTGRLVDPMSVNAIASAVMEFVEDRELRILAGARGRDVVRRRFEPTLVAAMYDQVYREVGAT